MTDTTKSRPEANPFMAPAFAGMMCEGMGRAAELARPAMKVAACTNLEVMSLAGHRARAWAEIPGTLARCRNPFDLMQAQMQFWQTAVRDYQAVGQRLNENWRKSLARTQDGARARDIISIGDGEDARRSERHAA